MRSNGFMTKFNLSKSTSTILIASLIVVSFAAFGIISIDAHHALLTKTYESGLFMPSLRDIENTNPEGYTITGEVQGENLLVTVIDLDANWDLNGPDEVFITTSSIASGSACASTFLEETENPGEFTGIITLSSETTSGSTLEAGRRDQISLFYEPHGDGVKCTNVEEEGGNTGYPRVKTTVILESGGDVTVFDNTLTEDQILNLCFRPVTQPVQILFSNGAVQTAGTDMDVTISYANAILLPGDVPALLQMYYNEHPLLGWVLVKSDHTTEGWDKVGETITSVPDQAGFISVLSDGLTEGRFVLGFNTGCGGGGGGGLVRPSLVVNALVGIGGGFGGGADGSPPLVELSELVKYSHLGIPLEIEQMVLNHDSTISLAPMELGLYETFDYPMTINDKGFVLGGFTSTIKTQTIKTDSVTVIKFILYETTKIQHISFYTNLRDTNSQIHQSDTQILYNDGQPLQIIDPNGYFSDVSVTINEINENKKEAVYEITFAKPMPTSDVIIRSWDPYFNSRDAFILDAFEVVSGIIEETPIPTYEEPVIEELQSQSIPKWIKNNAAWWSEQQISDSDFVSGIEYLIKNGIINVPGVEVGTDSASTEIPEWIKNNAAWWADSLISDDEFLNAMQWLVANGVIQI